MTSNAKQPRSRWSLSDLVDFEALLARTDGIDEVGRRHFMHNIRPLLADAGNESARRRLGFLHWLDFNRGDQQAGPGLLLGRALDVSGWVAFALLGLSGMGLVSGLLLGSHEAVHVVIFFGLTLLLPWLIYLSGALVRVAGSRRATVAPVPGRAMLRLVFRDSAQQARIATLMTRLTEARAPRRALSAVMDGVMQRGAIGFYLGVMLAFAGCLMLFDIRFYWEATPRIGMDVLLSAVTQVIALPWSWGWPQALPDSADIAATRAAAGTLPAPGDGSWWRFLLLSLLVWGLLPRVVLLGVCHVRARRALAGLTFQSPRHRDLWRKLNTVERGEVAAQATDGVLVLDVGGHGVTGDSIRGYLLRKLRVNPLVTSPVAVLDTDGEARTDEHLAAGPAGVVLLVEGWTLSPRQVEKLHVHLRSKLGNDTPVTWLVFSLLEGRPAAPDTGDMQRWTEQIDALRDPATEVAAYDG